MVPPYRLGDTHHPPALCRGRAPSCDKLRLRFELPLASLAPGCVQKPRRRAPGSSRRGLRVKPCGRGNLF
jgi:hypothetical protein